MTTHTEGELKILVHVGPCVIGTAEREVAEFYADGEEQTAEDLANARRAIDCWNACIGVPADVLEQLATGEAVHSITVYRRQASEIEELRDTLAHLYDAVQRGDFDHVGIPKSAEAMAAQLALAKRGATFDEYGRRAGAIDKHGNVTE